MLGGLGVVLSNHGLTQSLLAVATLRKKQGHFVEQHQPGLWWMHGERVLTTGWDDFGPRTWWNLAFVFTIEVRLYRASLLLPLLLLKWRNNEHKAPMLDDHPYRLFSYGECFDEYIVRLSPCDTILRNLTFYPMSMVVEPIYTVFMVQRFVLFRSLWHPIACFPYGLKVQVKRCS